MATSGSFTIGGTSPDYSTIQAWSDSPTGDLTGIYEGKGRAVTFTEQVDIDHSHATTASNYMKLTYDTGAYHNGVIGSGVVLTSDDTSSAPVLNVNVAFTRIIGIEITDWYGQSAEGISHEPNADGARYENLLIHNGLNRQADCIHLNFTAGDSVFISNCWLSYVGRSAILSQNDAEGTIHVYNVTCINTRMGARIGGQAGIGSQNSTVGHTWKIKNTYVHTYAYGDGAGVCYAKEAASSYSTSTNNASSDGTAPGTSPQTSAALASQFIQEPLQYKVGLNSGDDFGGSWEDTYIEASASSTNYGTSALLKFAVASGVASKNFLVRADLSSVPSATRVLASVLRLEVLTEGAANHNFTVHVPDRNWVVDEVTWDDYATSIAWTTGGGLSSTDLVEDARGVAGYSQVLAGSFRTDEGAPGDESAVIGGKMKEWAQEAIDGAGGAAKGVDWLDLLISWASSGDDSTWEWDSADDASGERPYFLIDYDTAATPMDMTPIESGVLDGNGVDLGSDSDYAIGDIDIANKTRHGDWAIGAWMVLQTILEADGVDIGDSATEALIVKPSQTDGIDTGDSATVAIVKAVAGVDGVDLGDSAPAPLVRPHSTLIIRGP